jgi:hypothetical protein
VLAAANIINSGTGSKISPQSIVEQSQREWLKAEASAMIPVLKQQLQKISSALCDPDECVQKCERAVQSIVSEFFDYNASQYSAHLLEESGERIHKEGHELALAVAEQNKQAVQKVIAAAINEFDTYVATNFHDLWMQKLKQNGPIPGSSDAEEEETLNSSLQQCLQHAKSVHATALQSAGADMSWGCMTVALQASIARAESLKSNVLTEHLKKKAEATSAKQAAAAAAAAEKSKVRIIVFMQLLAVCYCVMCVVVHTMHSHDLHHL